MAIKQRERPNPQATTATETPGRVSRPLEGRAYVPEVEAAQALGDQPLRVPGHRPPWTYLACPTRLMCRNGQIVARLAKAPHVAGLDGNGKNGAGAVGMIANMENRGWMRIPHNTEVTAFGEKRTGYLREYEGVIGYRSGPLVSYYVDAWTRPYQLGHETRWERDEEGWFAFQLQCLRLVWPHDLDPAQVQIAIEPPIRALRIHQGKQSGPSRQVVQATLANLPRDHIPADLAHMLQEGAP